VITELNQQLLEHHEKFPLFGIILFTEAHAHMVKMLKDRQYYAALDEISGDQVVVFATMLFRGEYEYPEPPPNSFAMMKQIWKEPKENEKVLSWFGVKDSRHLPMFVLFGVIENELYHQNHPLQSASVEDAFNSLQQVLSAISVQVQESKGTDRKELFKKAQWEIKKLQAKQKVRDILGTISQFRGVTGA
jgi:hypothetical protein